MLVEAKGVYSCLMNPALRFSYPAPRAVQLLGSAVTLRDVTGTLYSNQS